MNVTVEQKGPCRKVMQVVIPAEDITKDYEALVNVYQKQARVDGFRPGKAPRDIVKRRFAKDIQEDLKDQLIRSNYHQALAQQKIKPVAILDMQEPTLVLGQPMTFTVTLDVVPEFELPKYLGLAIQGKTVEVTDQEVTSSLDHLRGERAQYNDIKDRVVQKGDMAQVDYEGTFEGQSIKILAPKATMLDQAKDFWAIMDEENEFLPGFSKGLLGAAIGETRSVDVTFGAAFIEKDLAGKKVTYRVTVKALRERILPEANDAFAEGYGLKTLEDLKTEIRKGIQRSHERQETSRQRSQIIDLLLKNTTMDLPESVVSNETRETVYHMVSEQSRQGISKDEIEQHKEETFETAGKTAGGRVKLRYILHQISENEKIEVSDKDLTMEIARLAAQYQLPVDQFRADLEKREAIDDVREELRWNKTLDYLLSKAVITPEAS